MDTAKQVNVMIGLLMVFAVGTLLYFLWEDDRASEATDRQLLTNAERGGALYSLNCRACHGLTGLGALENGILPGLPLNTDQNKSADQSRQNYLRETIRCGRLGTVMPPWHTDFGGSLNDFQILQLVTLITSTASAEGWAHAIEQANHADEFVPAKHLTQAVGADDVTLALDNARGLRPGSMLRLDEKPDDEVYEVVLIVDAPAGSVLTEDASRDSTELTVQEAAVFHPSDKITVGAETMEVVDAPASTVLVDAISATDTKITVTDPQGLGAGDVIKIHGEKLRITSITGDTANVQRAVEDTTAAEHAADSAVTEQGNVIQVRRGQDGTAAASHKVKAAVYEIGDSITVERAAFATTAAEHPQGTEVFNGPILPGNTITGSGEGNPPCGQSKALIPTPTPAGGSPSPAAAVPITGAADVTIGDNFFELQGQRNPTLQMAAGSTVRLNFKNNGVAIHNFRTAGADGTFGNADDHQSEPTIAGGASGSVEITFAAPGTYQYRCDFHATQMFGQITVQ